VLISYVIQLCIGTLYPAYCSFKAIKNKDLKEYRRWLMYWVVFAFFCSGEIVSDFFLAFWFPFYSQIKLLIVLWLLNSWTRGSSTIYQSLIQPYLIKNEQKIDSTLKEIRNKTYDKLYKLVCRVVTFARRIAMKNTKSIYAQVIFNQALEHEMPDNIVQFTHFEEQVETITTELKEEYASLDPQLEPFPIPSSSHEHEVLHPRRKKSRGRPTTTGKSKSRRKGKESQGTSSMTLENDSQCNISNRTRRKAAIIAEQMFKQEAIETSDD